MTQLHQRLQKVLWFVGIWGLSVLALGLVAYFLRWVLGVN